MLVSIRFYIKSKKYRVLHPSIHSRYGVFLVSSALTSTLFSCRLAEEKGQLPQDGSLKGNLAESSKELSGHPDPNLGSASFSLAEEQALHMNASAQAAPTLSKKKQASAVGTSSETGHGTETTPSNKDQGKQKLEIIGEQLAPALGHLSIPFQENRGQWPDVVAFKASGIGETLWLTKDGEMIHSFHPKHAVRSQQLSKFQAQDRSDRPLVHNFSKPAANSAANKRKLDGYGYVEGDADKSDKLKADLGLSYDVIERFVDQKPVPLKLKAKQIGPTLVSYFIGDDPKKWASSIRTSQAVDMGEIWDGIRVELKKNGKGVEKYFYVEPGANVSSIRLSLEQNVSAQSQSPRPTVLNPVGKIADINSLFSKPGSTRGQLIDDRSYDDHVETLIGPPTAASFYLHDTSHRLYLNSAKKKVHLTRYGTLHISTGEQEIELSQPKAYQISENGTHSEVSVEYTFQDHSEDESMGKGSLAFSYGFKIGSYDPNRELVIDPILQSTYLGGEKEDSAYAISVGASGDVYVAGRTNSDNFPNLPGPPQPNRGSGTDGFVARLSADLKTLRHFTYFGGANSDRISSMVVTGDQVLKKDTFVFVAGLTSSDDLPNIQGGATSSHPPGLVSFASKLKADLSESVQSTYIGSSPILEPILAVDGLKNVYIAGTTNGALDATKLGGALQPTYGGGIDAFVTKLVPDLTHIIRNTYFGGSGNEFLTSFVMSAGGDLFLGGNTSSPNLPGANQGAYPNLSGTQDAFVAKLNSDLTAVTQSTYLGTSGLEYLYSLALGKNGDLYAAGETDSNSFGGVIDQGPSTGFDRRRLFVVKLAGSLKQPFQHFYLFPRNRFSGIIPKLILTPSHENLFVMGFTNLSQFPGTSAAAQGSLLAKNSNYNIFLSKFDLDLTNLVQSTYLGGSGATGDLGYALTADEGGDLLVAGATSSSDFSHVAEGHQTSYGGGISDSFVSRLSPDLTQCLIVSETLDCASSSTPMYCDLKDLGPGGSCKNKLGNGQAIPSTATLDGLCTAETGTRVCLSRICATSGSNAHKCVECTNPAHCANDVLKPVCQRSSNLCKPCDGNFGESSSAPCSAQTAPICIKDGEKAGSCVPCTTNYPSTAQTACYDPTKPVCNKTLGVCGAACNVDSDCRVDEWCDNPTFGPYTGVCSAKVENGKALPSSDPIFSTCSPKNAERTCLLATCDELDNLCGIKNGSRCFDPDYPQACRSSICYLDLRCGVPNGARYDLLSDAGGVVDQAEKKCRSGYGQNGVCLPKSTGDAAADASSPDAGSTPASSALGGGACSMAHSNISDLNMACLFDLFLLLFSRRTMKKKVATGL